MKSIPWEMPKRKSSRSLAVKADTDTECMGKFIPTRERNTPPTITRHLRVVSVLVSTRSSIVPSASRMEAPRGVSVITCG
jgi:hypothetical protein